MLLLEVVDVRTVPIIHMAMTITAVAMISNVAVIIML
jgi:hypothetical protein